MYHNRHRLFSLLMIRAATARLKEQQSLRDDMRHRDTFGEIGVPMPNKYITQIDKMSDPLHSSHGCDHTEDSEERTVIIYEL